MSQKVAYLISAVAKMLDIHPQTLRQYEKEGLVEPSRSDGKMRLYSAKDIERVREVLRLTRQMGVNLAGAKLILELQSKISYYESLLKEKPSKNALVKSAKYEIVFLGRKSKP